MRRRDYSGSGQADVDEAWLRAIKRLDRLRFTLTDVELGDAIDVLSISVTASRHATGWDVLMTELERRQDGAPAEDVRLQSSVFDTLPSAVQEILGEHVSVKHRLAA
jgi:hypothetical protein